MLAACAQSSLAKAGYVDHGPVVGFHDVKVDQLVLLDLTRTHLYVEVALQMGQFAGCVTVRWNLLLSDD